MMLASSAFFRACKWMNERFLGNVQARVTPIDQCGKAGNPCLVKVTEVDPRGISFSHRLPITERRAIVTLESSRFGRVATEVELSWCRFNRTGQYTSGGRFVQPIGLSA